MPYDLKLTLAGLVVGLLIGSTGMGAGSLMAPVLITIFGVPAVAAVGTTSSGLEAARRLLTGPGGGNGSSRYPTCISH